MGRLDHKIAFITGAAGSIGAATARRFVAEGARVALTDLDADALDALAAELGADRALALPADVTDSGAVADAVARAVERFGGLDVAFANAGVFGAVAPVVDYPEDVFDRVMAVNVRGPFLVAKHALAAMRDGGSMIINSSVVGLTADPGIVAYATSKHALVGLMRTAAKEMAPRGIRVNTLHPGPVANAFQHRIELTATGAATEAEAARAFEAMIPLDRHATPEEVAAAVLFLASDESAFLTGATVPLDGGMSV
ncbi:MAG TPA: SDR family NAD(P)-dependent oxidoreductase [Baekduia sp.]|uniref:SDR family NAD(P)-dependent oxidoreductase n=1 Tax=Baekduia sp. TaxID=2600305 RepID=UPI002D78B6F5|nr:SDR family NAD(P)-dependent oxidoreductase [Baekduia sp.]HET6507319.1 SDR family NAD(P)-dependent oxidoreductase [Baekduia sp.]